MNMAQREAWEERLRVLQTNISDLKYMALREHNLYRLRGAKSIASALSGLEGFCWGIKDVVTRFPKEKGDSQQELAFGS